MLLNTDMSLSCTTWQTLIIRGNITAKMCKPATHRRPNGTRRLQSTAVLLSGYCHERIIVFNDRYRRVGEAAEKKQVKAQWDGWSGVVDGEGKQGKGNRATNWQSVGTKSTLRLPQNRIDAEVRCTHWRWTPRSALLSLRRHLSRSSRLFPPHPARPSPGWACHRSKGSPAAGQRRVW